MNEIISTPEGLTRKHRMQTRYDDFAFGTESWRAGREGFREFPMAIPLVDGKPCFDEKVRKAPYDYSVKPPRPLEMVRVHSQDELEALMEGAQIDTSGPVPVVETDTSIIENLWAEAAVAGVKVDKRWSAERVRKAIEDAKGGPIL